MNIPKHRKLFLQIVRETSVRESDGPGFVREIIDESGHADVRESVCPGTVLSGKVIVQETDSGKRPFPGRIALYGL